MEDFIKEVMLARAVKKAKVTMQMPVQLAVTAYRAGIAALKDAFGLSREQAEAVLQPVFNEIVTRTSTVIDVREEHPDWSDEEAHAEIERRLADGRSV